MGRSAGLSAGTRGQATAAAVRYNSKRQATLAQLVERLIRNQQVAGSTPAGGSINY